VGSADDTNDGSHINIEETLLAHKLKTTRFFSNGKLGLSLSKLQISQDQVSISSDDSVSSPIPKRPRQTDVQKDVVMFWLPGTGSDANVGSLGNGLNPSDVQNSFLPIPTVEDPFKRVVLGSLVPADEVQRSRVPEQGFAPGRVITTPLWEYKGEFMGPRLYLQKAGANPPLWNGREEAWDNYTVDFALWLASLAQAQHQLNLQFYSL
jgi:hypothetical protein